MEFRIKTCLLLLIVMGLSQAIVYGSDCGGQKILTQKTCVGDDLDLEEKRLYQMVNEYRIAQGLSSIPSSPSLQLVANRHIRDLAENHHLLSQRGLHWIHGWSNCPYDAENPQTFSCMWEAPKRLRTPYPGMGFEIFCGDLDVKYRDFVMTANYAFNTWKKSRLHREVILNQGTWKRYSWKAMGVGIYKGFAAIWFGTEPDPLSKRNP